MDYLHGDVTGDEFEAACAYEYARESKILREAAAIHDALIRHKKAHPVPDETKRTDAGFFETYFYGKPMTPFKEAASLIAEQFNCGDWITLHPWGHIWQCPTFPGKPWNQLSEQERARILPAFAPTDPQPLAMTDVATLDAMQIFTKFRKLAYQARKQSERSIADNKPFPPTVYPVLHQDQWAWALFTIDFSKPKTRLRQEFEAWLELPDYKARLKKQKRERRGTADLFKDRLKDLATWRLYDDLPKDGLDRFATLSNFTENEKNRKRFKRFALRGGVRYKKDDFMPFHDPRPGKEKVPLNQAPLYSEQAGCLDAIRRAKQYLGEVIHWEFGQSAKSTQSKFVEAWGKRLKKASKASKSSF